MQMNELYLIYNNIAKQIESATQLSAELNSCWATNPPCVSLELRKGSSPKKWEKIIYPLLGLRIPLNTISLTIYRNQHHALIVYEVSEEEWLPENGDSGDGYVAFRTHQGEDFTVPLNTCIAHLVANRLMEEFFITKKKPATIQWKKTN